jgi:hypothetical protein
MKDKFRKSFLYSILIIGILFFIWRFAVSVFYSELSFFKVLIGEAFFAVWIFFPYILYFYIFKKKTIKKISLILAGVFIVVVDFYFHAEVLLWPSSSTSGLIFLISPFILLVIMFIGFGIGWVIEKLYSRFKK